MSAAPPLATSACKTHICARNECPNVPSPHFGLDLVYCRTPATLADRTGAGAAVLVLAHQRRAW